ncbi:MAG: transposase [Endomicrobiales bacterium]|nr:transposase [Endomicrobiales bacterium]
MNNLLHNRKSIRLKNYDYSSNGYYFVTICTKNAKPFITRYHKTIKAILYSLPTKINGLNIDYTCLMPTHIHTIFILNNVKKTLGEIIRMFKALVTKETGLTNFWQRNYYEHVIRNEKALLKIREYIQNNPLAEKLKFDQFYK